jgi:Holliday junction resolvasome RuvABC ATP-dependent DNA helicase subunit
MRLQDIGARLNLDNKTIQNNVEPFLLQRNLIQRAAHGRVITPEGRAILAEIA